MSISLTPQKTLAEIALDATKKRYVSLETASKITGYTAEYLKRLCDLYRLEYRLRQDGNYAVEIDALLHETQTILISYEGIPFLDTELLLDPHPKVEPPPEEVVVEGGAISEAETVSSSVNMDFAEGVHMRPTEESRAGVLSFVGRSVISDPDHPESLDEEPVIAPIHVPIVDVSEHGVTVPSKSAPHMDDVNTSPSSHIEHGASSSVSVAEAISRAEKSASPSLYRPIATSVDPGVHHDEAPLFPPLEEKKPAPIPEKLVISPPVVEALPPEVTPSPLPPPSPVTPLPVPLVFPEMMSAPSFPSVPAVKSSPSVELPPSKEMEQILRSVPELTGMLDHREIPSATPPLLGSKITAARQVLQQSAVGVFHPSTAKSLPPRRAEPLLSERHPLLLEGHNIAVVGLVISAVGLTTFFGVSFVQHPSSVAYDETIKTSLAGVGAVSTQATSSNTHVTTAPPVYPPSGVSQAFSDEVSVTSGENGKVEVRPIFRDHMGNPVSNK